MSCIDMVSPQCAFSYVLHKNIPQKMLVTKWHSLFIKGVCVFKRMDNMCGACFGDCHADDNETIAA